MCFSNNLFVCLFVFNFLCWESKHKATKHMPIFSFFLFACFAKDAGIETISHIAPSTPFLKAPPTCGWTPGSDVASVLTFLVTNEDWRNSTTSQINAIFADRIS